MNMQKLVKRAASALLGLSLLTAPVFADTIGGATVTTNDTGLNLRSSASTGAEALTVIPNGSFLLVEDVLGGWYKVSYNGVTGYVSSNYARFSETLDGTYAFSASTAGTDVNLRQGPGLDNSISGFYGESGAALTVLGVSGSWLHVKDAAGADGYIRSDLVRYSAQADPAAAAGAESVPSIGTASSTVAPAAPAAASAPSVGEQMAATAKQYLGYSYAWGGMSPATGFDCSGFVNYIYNLYGYKLERVAQNIFNTNGYSVAYADLKPGDLLFFGYSADSIGHVGMYVGDGQMIHASTYTTGVILSKLDGTEYGGSFMGARRVV